MKLIDRISAHRLLQTLLNFILALVKILVPKADDKSDKDKNPWVPRWRRKKNEQ